MKWAFFKMRMFLVSLQGAVLDSNPSIASFRAQDRSISLTGMPTLKTRKREGSIANRVTAGCVSFRIQAQELLSGRTRFRVQIALGVSHIAGIIFRDSHGWAASLSSAPASGRKETAQVVCCAICLLLRSTWEPQRPFTAAPTP